MNKKFKDFQSMRRDIFGNIVKLCYEDRLKNEIDGLPGYYQEIGDRNEITTIKNEILIAMGLNPTARYDTEMAAEVDAVLNLKEVEEPLVTVNTSICEKCNKKACADICINNPEKGLLIEDGRCISCGDCIPRCPLGAISDKIEFIPMVKYIKKGIPVYANVAPSIVGQFGEEITPGMLRSALKSIGFSDMVEVALFADIITLREAKEYNENVLTEDDFLITSCCCPVWINLLTKYYPELSKRLTKTVSPMIASGRVIKTIFPGAITVFIGPCIAKKAEARVTELKGAIDYVLTFDELNQIFTALDVNLSEMKDDNKEQSSLGGRIYGRTGGVSESVRITLERINPDRNIKFRAVQVDGIENCKRLLDDLKKGNVRANFIEGMACEGGCVGGPKRVVDIKDGTRYINEYGQKAQAQNPLDNQNISHILRYLNRIEEGNIDIIDQLSFDHILLREYKET
jgi:iron only hydrogenase large subunit-like protein